MSSPNPTQPPYGGLRAGWRTVRCGGAATPLSWYHGQRHSEESRAVDRRLGIDARTASGASTQRESRAVDGGQHHAPGGCGAYRRPGGEMQPVRKDRAVSDGNPDRAARSIVSCSRATARVVRRLRKAPIRQPVRSMRRALPRAACDVHAARAGRAEGVVYGSGIGACSATWPSHRDQSRPVGRSARQLPWDAAVRAGSVAPDKRGFSQPSTPVAVSPARFPCTHASAAAFACATSSDAPRRSVDIMGKDRRGVGVGPEGSLKHEAD